MLVDPIDDQKFLILPPSTKTAKPMNYVCIVTIKKKRSTKTAKPMNYVCIVTIKKKRPTFLGKVPDPNFRYSGPVATYYLSNASPIFANNKYA